MIGCSSRERGRREQALDKRSEMEVNESDEIVAQMRLAVIGMLGRRGTGTLTGQHGGWQEKTAADKSCNSMTEYRCGKRTADPNLNQRLAGGSWHRRSTSGLAFPRGYRRTPGLSRLVALVQESLSRLFRDTSTYG